MDLQKKSLAIKINQGVTYALVATFVFSLMNLLVKLVSARIPTGEIVFFRSSIGAVVAYTLIRKNRIKMNCDKLFFLTLRGVLGASYLVTYFYIIAKIPLADVAVLINLSPLLVIFLSAVVLKEKLSTRTYVVIAIGLIGALITINPLGYSTYSVIALVGVFSAFCSAGASISIRYLSKYKSTHEIVFFFLFFAALVSLPMMWRNFVIPTCLELFYLIGIATVSYAGQFFLTKAYTHEKAPVVAVARYSSIAYNVFWGLLLWGEIPTITTVIGGTLIVGACIWISLKK